jgi:hypothetical protein
VPRKSSFSSETHRETSSHSQTWRYNHYGGTSPMSLGFPRVFSASRRYIPIIPHCLCNRNHAQPSPSRESPLKPRSHIACMLLCARPTAYRPVMAVYIMQALGHPLMLSLSPCLLRSITNRRFITPLRRRERAHGLDGLRSVLWSRRLFWPSKASTRLCPPVGRRGN